jgi:hypothetical protein
MMMKIDSLMETSVEATRSLSNVVGVCLHALGNHHVVDGHMPNCSLEIGSCTFALSLAQWASEFCPAMLGGECLDG